MRDPEEVAAAFDKAARSLGIRYTFIGGLAVNAWGQPRATQDADCLLELRPDLDAPFSRALEKERLRVAAEDFADARTEGSHVTVFDQDSSFHVDCKLTTTRDETDQIDGAKELRVLGARLRVARAEDTIAFKLLFGSPQDLQDARSILVRQEGRLDEGRLNDLAERLGVAEKLMRLRAEAKG